MFTIDKIEKDKTLKKLVEECVLNDKIEKLHELLIAWKENTLQRLIYIESRMIAPSTSEIDAQKLAVAREKALLNSALLKEYEAFYSNFGKDNSFSYSEVEKKQYQILEALENICSEMDDKPNEKLDVFLKSIDLTKQSLAIQHQAHKIIYNQLFCGYQTDFLNQYSKTWAYRNWEHKFSVKKVLKNKYINFDIIKEFAELEYQLEWIKSKDYYHYLQQMGKAKTTFEDFFKKFGTHYTYGNVANEKQITAFERKQSIKLPKELKDFYQTFGDFKGEVCLNIDIWSINCINDKLNGTSIDSLKSIGLADVLLSYFWYGEKEAMQECFTTQEIKKLNTAYTVVGYIALNDDFSAMLIIYFDQKDKFDMVFMDNSFIDSSLERFINPLLEKSTARFSLKKLLTAIMIPISVCDFGRNYNWHDDLWVDLLSVKN